MKPLLTQNIVKEFLNYNPDTGEFHWKKRELKWFKNERSFKMWNTRYPGKLARSDRVSNKKIYSVLAIFGENEYLHRLVFLYMKGYMPEKVDHNNGDGTDNRWCNLREATVTSNAQNMRLPSDNKSGVIGVSFVKERWRTVIVINGKQKHIGMFKTLQEAKKARKEYEKKYGFHQNHGSIRPL